MCRSIPFILSFISVLIAQPSFTAADIDFGDTRDQEALTDELAGPMSNWSAMASREPRRPMQTKPAGSNVWVRCVSNLEPTVWISQLVSSVSRTKPFARTTP